MSLLSTSSCPQENISDSELLHFVNQIERRSIIQTSCDDSISDSQLLFYTNYLESTSQLKDQTHDQQLLLEEDDTLEMLAMDIYETKCALVS